MLFPETFLHYLWRYQLFDHQELRTTDGESLLIAQVGQPNPYGGADFAGAQIYLGAVRWAGDVEIHYRASDWKRHGHQHDEAYNKVILHVVYIADAPILHTDGSPLPTLELKPRLSTELLYRYLQLYQNEAPIPCQAHFADNAPAIFPIWAERLLIERLQTRCEQLEAHLQHTQDHWDEAMYRMLARALGTHANGEAFEELARSLPLGVLLKNRDSLPTLEALLLGQANLLDGLLDAAERHQAHLQYEHLRHKHQLAPLPAHRFQKFGMRPANQPVARIRQLAALVYLHPNLLSKMLETSELKTALALLQQPLAASPNQPERPVLAKAIAQTLVINAVVPALFGYARAHADEAQSEKALRWLEQLPAEDNQPVRQYRALGLSPKSAYETQALMGLHKNYCAAKRCCACAIGHKILSAVGKNL